MPNKNLRFVKYTDQTQAYESVSVSDLDKKNEAGHETADRKNGGSHKKWRVLPAPQHWWLCWPYPAQAVKLCAPPVRVWPGISAPLWGLDRNLQDYVPVIGTLQTDQLYHSAGQ